MSDRRTFIQQALGGTAALAASAVFPSGVLGANDRIRFGLIGAGDRGMQDFAAALKCPNVEAVAVADVYTRRLDHAKTIVPGIKTYQDYRQLLDDKSIDAVLIVTPQHLHCAQFTAALAAGKDVYQEKTMAFNPEHGRKMRRAFEKSDRVVQIGIQVTSAPGYAVIKEMITPEKMGDITALHTHHFRNRRNGGWLRRIPEDCDPQHVDWAGFEGGATHYEFDPNRLINWRFFWDYDGSNVYENMVHQVGFWYKVMDFKIPDTVTMIAANILSPKMQMPDTMDICMMQGNLMFTWNSMFGNDFYGEGHDMLLGTHGTIARNESDQIRYQPQGRNRLRGVDTISSVTPVGGQESGYYEATDQHMQNFFDCMRSRKQPNCPFEIGYRSAIACQMAITSYHRKRTVTWNAQTEDIDSV